MEKEPIVDITVKLVGEDGNAFAIMAKVGQAMRRAECNKALIDQFLKEAMSGDYDHLLTTVMKYVNIE